MEFGLHRIYIKAYSAGLETAEQGSSMKDGDSAPRWLRETMNYIYYGITILAKVEA